MTDQFIGEIKIVSFNFAPRGWAFCNGQLLPINQNQALFALLGTTYGGNGQTTFALPNLQGRAPLHFGKAPQDTQGFVLGQTGGEAAHSLSVNEVPPHVHFVQATNNAAAGDDASNNVLAQAGLNLYTSSSQSGAATMAPGALGNLGSGAQHENMQPYLVLSFCIALDGIFPSQN